MVEIDSASDSEDGHRPALSNDNANDNNNGASPPGSFAGESVETVPTRRISVDSVRDRSSGRTHPWPRPPSPVGGPWSAYEPLDGCGIVEITTPSDSRSEHNIGSNPGDHSGHRVVETAVATRPRVIPAGWRSEWPAPIDNHGHREQQDPIDSHDDREQRDPIDDHGSWKHREQWSPADTPYYRKLRERLTRIDNHAYRERQERWNPIDNYDNGSVGRSGSRQRRAPGSVGWRSRSSSRSRNQRRSGRRYDASDYESFRSSSRPRTAHEVAEVIYYTDSGEDEKDDNPEDAPSEWTQAKTTLERGLTTELLVAHSIELKTFKSGRERISMICPSAPPSSAPGDREVPKLRWLHIQQTAPATNSTVYAIRLIERMFLRCPFVSSKERGLGAVFLQSHILRSLKEADENRVDVFSSTFTTSFSQSEPCPSLAIREFLLFDKVRDSLPYTKPLLAAARGYDVLPDDELNQVARKMEIGDCDHVLKIGMVWSFIFPPRILITLSCQPMAEIRGDLVSVDDRIGRDFYTVQVKEFAGQACAHLVIDPDDCSYVSFLQRAVAAITSGIETREVDAYELLYTSHNVTKPPCLPLTPTTWLELIASDNVESTIFYLKRRDVYLSRERRPYHFTYTQRTRKPAMPESPQRPRRRPLQEAQDSFSAPWSDIPRGHDSAAVVLTRGPQPFRSSRESSRRRGTDLNPRPHEPGYGMGNGKHILDKGAIPSEDEQGQVVISNRSRKPPGLTPFVRDDHSEPGRRSFHQRTDPHWPQAATSGDFKTPHRASSPDGVYHEPFPTSRSEDSGSATPTSKDSAGRRERQGTPIPDIITIPFLAWKTSSRKPHDGRPPATEPEVLFRILGKISESLSSPEARHRNTYLRAFQCTQDELLRRHPFLAAGASGIGQQQAHPHVNTSSSSPGGGDTGGKKKDDDSRGIQTPFGPNHDTAPPQQGSREEAEADGPSPQDDLRLIREDPRASVSKQLLERSQAILSQFLPTDNHNTAYHPVCQRVWGAVDEMIRQLCWSYEPARETWTVRKLAAFPSLGSKGNAISKHQHDQCSSCLEGHGYSSPSEALEHLHAHHVECPLDEKAAARCKNNPADDPCFAYLESGPVIEAHDPGFDAIMDTVNLVLEDLAELDNCLKRLHRLVAKTRRPASLRNRPGTARPDKTQQPPQLPRSLVYAFEELVSYFVVVPRSLSIMNRTIAEFGHCWYLIPDAESRVSRINDLRLEVCSSVHKHFHQAECDICMLPTMRETADEDDANVALGIRTLDFSSLARIIEGSILRSSIFKPSFRGLGATCPAGVAPKDAVVDVVAMYREYCQRLRSEADSRPRRRLFLDITALLDELGILSSIFNVALNEMDVILHELGCVIHGPPLPDPRSYPELRLSAVEHESLTHQRAVLNVKAKEIERLINLVGSVQGRVKQMIEVMDEDHGKAIRVFTVVTVLFVPMTFVSGFFGMNTSDIRDIDANQTLYWEIAVPVTILTLLVAFAYGYKGDEIGDWLYDKFHRAGRHHRLPGKAAGISAPPSGRLPLSEPPGGQTNDKRSATKPKQVSIKFSVRDRVRRRKQRDPRRKNTFESMLS
ncbi:hypothetical protein VTJ83DRAFT_6432 [Remersonia thermophila]|uniref:Uncharacterized protein n=1 Tax=Remersonia thermophila TaxID=72144 RepID=A0ABR4D4U0_9PEZI